MAWVLLLAGLLLAFVVGSLAVGAWRPDLTVVIAPPPTPTGTPVATPTPTPGASMTSLMTTPRAFHTATLLTDGHVLIIGGSEAFFQPLASAELYDPATGTFHLTGSMTTAGGVTATRLLDGRVLIVGGAGARADDGSKAEIYDPETGTFKPTGSMKTPRWEQTATLLPDGRILVAGGRDPNPNATGDFVALTSAELYDPKQGTFSPTGSLTTARGGQTATLLADGRVLIAGLDQSGVLASAELYDPATGTFGPTGP
jgi:hypothetical protein